MDKILLRCVIDKMMKLDSNDDFAFEECCKKITDNLTENVDITIKYILNDCSDEDFFWISPVFEDVAKITQSLEFISAIKIRLSQVTIDNYNFENFKSELLRKNTDYLKYHNSISMDIRYAEENIESK